MSGGTSGVYLDNAATTRVRPEAVDEMVRALSVSFGNPSSPHRLGLEAERLLRAARRDVAAALAVEPDEVIFTSGGTEANNLAILGTARARRRHGNHVIATRIEHPSVLKACAQLEEEGFAVTYLPVDRRGLIDPAGLAGALRPETVLVTTMHVNNETGATQPLAEIGRVLERGSTEGGSAERGSAVGPGRRPVWHVDAVQSFTRLPLEPHRLGMDLVSVSAHKIHGPKGCGALCVRRGLELHPLLVGGGQEDGRRAGTENVPGIVGFAAAARLAMAEREAAVPRLREMRRRLAEGVMAAVPGARLNGPGLDDAAAAPHIASVSFPGLKGEVLVHALEDAGIFVSTGAACSTRRTEPSHVLAAMGLGPREMDGTVRISLSAETSPGEIDRVIAEIARAVAEISHFVRR